MNIAKEIYTQIANHVGNEKKIKGLSPTQRKLFKSGEYNPTIGTIKTVLVENGMPATICITSGTTETTINF